MGKKKAESKGIIWSRLQKKKDSKINAEMKILK